MVSVIYAPPRAAAQIAIAGEWNAWTPQSLGPPDLEGRYHANLRLAPGVYGYKLVLDGTEWRLHERNPYRKYVGGVENSGLRVPDCQVPQQAWAFVAARRAPADRSQRAGSVSRPHRDRGGQRRERSHLQRRARCAPTRATSPADLRPLSPTELTMAPDHKSFTVQLTDLPDGKYTLSLSAVVGGRKTEPIILPFWIEAEKFALSDTPLYMAVTDRFSDGDPRTTSRWPAWSVPRTLSG